MNLPARPAMLARTSLVAALAVAALIVAGCGEGPTATPRDGVLEVRLTEYRIAPARIRIAAGRVELQTINDGILTHNLEIETQPRDGRRRPRTVARTVTLHPGERARKRTRLGPGNYRLVCTIQNHADLGQHGLLTVR